MVMNLISSRAVNTNDPIFLNPAWLQHTAKDVSRRQMLVDQLMSSGMFHFVDMVRERGEWYVRFYF